MVLKYLKYSGVWIGIVINPFHWQFGWYSGEEGLFDNAVHLGLIWIRIIIDDGNW
jgi:hypothetical protein